MKNKSSFLFLVDKGAANIFEGFKNLVKLSWTTDNPQQFHEITLKRLSPWKICQLINLLFSFFLVDKGAANIFEGWCDLVQDPVGGAPAKHGGGARRHHGYLRQIDRCSQEAIRDPHKRPRKVSPLHSILYCSLGGSFLWSQGYNLLLRQIDQCSQESTRDPHKRPRKISHPGLPTMYWNWWYADISSLPQLQQ